MICLTLCGRGLAQVSPPLTDQSDVRIISSFVAPGKPVPPECRQQAHIFAELLVRYPRPGSWHWILVCDEAGWRRFLRLSGRPEEAGIYASTELDARTTYLRGAKLLCFNDINPSPNQIVAHELAHIWLQSDDEARSNRLARRWHEGGR